MSRCTCSVHSMLY